MYLSPGREVTVVLSGTRSSVEWNFLPLCTELSDAMQAAGDPVDIRACGVRETGGLLDLPPRTTIDYTLTITVAGRVAFAHENDLAALLAGRLYDAIGYYPNSRSVTNIGGIPTGSTAPRAPDPGFLQQTGANIGNLFQRIDFFLLMFLLLAFALLFTSSGRRIVRTVTI